jgi:hypothetical protein
MGIQVCVKGQSLRVGLRVSLRVGLRAPILKKLVSGRFQKTNDEPSK